MYQTVFALLPLLVLTLEVSRVQSCPSSCNCYQANEVHCTFRSLITIPPGLPAHTRRINLGFNSIRRLHDKSLAGLKRVELLMLHSNELHQLPDAVFRDLKSLQILKLSYNKLREISSSLTFSGLTSLLRLYLDHNLLQHIHPRALLQLPNLRLLRLQGNRLHQLHPHALCTLSLLNTYYFSTLRHLDLSNNSLTTLSKESVATAPLLESLVLQPNPWSCDCRMNWLLSWSQAHPGLMKCLNGLQCPICASPTSLQGQGLLDQTALKCTSPIIDSPGKENLLDTDLSEIQSSETFREPLGSVSLGLSDQQGNSIDLSCNITHSTDSQDIVPPPDLSWTSSSPLHLALSISLECPIGGRSYEKLWRILAYYSETAVQLEREIMLSKAPALAYRYRQSPETDGYYHTGVKASVKARPQWLLQPAISIQLNRAESNGHKVQLIYSTRVSAHPDLTTHPSASSPVSHQWVMISTNRTTSALTAVAGRKVELSCPLLSSGKPSVYWILPDGSKFNSPSSSLNGRLQASASDLLIQKAQLSDAGIYYCVARAGGDVDVLPIRLVVEESSAPYSAELVSPPVTGEVGEAVSLSCRVSGSPEPSISWILPDRNVVLQGLVVSGGLTVHSNGSLSLHKLSLRDVGYYRCIAVNHYGSDSLSVQLMLDSPHIAPLEIPFPRGPQSASGKSTKIRASLFHQVDEGSGDAVEQEEQKNSIGKKRHPVSLQPHPNRHNPIRKLQRQGSERAGPLRRGGGPVSPTEHRRNHFQNRHRSTTKKLRMDPKSWADILAKIRQKAANASNSQTISRGNITAESIQEDRRTDTKGQGEGDNINTGRAEGTGIETETEGSSADDAILREDQTELIQPAHGDAQTTPGTKINAEIESGAETTEKYIDSKTETETETDTRIDIESTQTMTAVTPVAEKESVTSYSKSGTNEIVFQSSEVNKQGPSLNPAISMPRIPQRLFPNSNPNSWPQSPWNSRRKIGQRRRIKRPRIRPSTSPQPVSDHVTPTSTIDKSTMLLPVPTASDLTILLTTSDSIKNAPNGEAQNPRPTPFLDTSSISTSNFTSPSLTPSPAHTDTYTDIMTHSGEKSQTQDFTFNSTPAPTHPNNVISETHVPGIDTKTFTPYIQTHTETQTTISKHTERPPSSEDLERVLDESHFSLTPPLIVSLVPSASSATTTAATLITSASAAPKRAGWVGSTRSTSASMTSEDNLSTTTTVTTVSPTMPPSTSIVIPISRTTRQTLTTSISTTTTSTSTSSLTTTSAGTSTTTISPDIYTFSITTDPSTSTNGATVSMNDTFGTSTPSSTGTRRIETTNPTTMETISTKTPSATTRESTIGILSSTTTTTGSVTPKASSKKTPVIGQVDPRVRLFPGSPNQTSHNWKNHGANFIPDSHSSRFRWPPSSSLPATPGAVAVRSRPRIADPHIRTVSFPATSTARLTCEAQGNPTPSITWTKVATGVVMSIHSRAQRFEVLPNGTLVIQNVQLQDRGTYICSATSFLGRDRLLTTLDVWTRPPRMQLASYREVTIHQGGDVHLECQADGVPTPLLSWVLPDRSTLTSSGTSSSRISLDTNGTLHISVTLPSDRGLYRCVASNLAGAASASVRVHVSSLPPVIQQPREEHLLFPPGRPVYAHCSARGAPPPALRWRIPDGTLVRPSQFLHGNLFVLPNGTLHIRRVGPKDAGSYECTASNAVGTYKRTVKVEIEGGEELERQEEARNERVKETKTSNSSSFIKDRTLVFPSHPTDPFDSTKISPVYPSDRSRNPSISLSPSNSASNSSPKINKTVKAYPSHFTNIKKTNPPSVFSQSTVPTYNTNVPPSVNSTRVTSSFPADRKASSVSQPLPVSPFTKARIVSTSPSTSTINYGGTLKLFCTVTGNPIPNIIWRTPAKKLVDTRYSHDRRLKVYPNGTLLVQAVTEKDGGDYLCIARNKVSDDYRLLRVNVATKPAKIDPKQPLDYMVSFGKPLKMDCQASGLPHPAVRWRLSDGTVVNSVSQEKDTGEQPQKLTVFDNGTLLVPAMGMREEGEYMCYAENQAGQDIMKVKVKVLMFTPPTFVDDKAYHSIKVLQGAAAIIPCQARGDPAPTVVWFSPSQRAIPQSLGSGYYSERIVVASDGTLKLRSVQKIDMGNYTCQARNSAGIRSMVVSLEVETPTYGLGRQVGRGQGWSNNGERVSSYDIRSGDVTDNSDTIKRGSTSEITSKLSSSNSYSNNNGRVKNVVPNSGVNLVFSSSNPALRSYTQNKFQGPVGGYTAQLGNTGMMVGANGAQSADIKADSTQINRNGPNILNRSNNYGNNQSADRGNNGQRNSGKNNNEVIAGKTSNSNANANRHNSRFSGVSGNVGSFSGSLSHSGASTSTIRGHGFSVNSNLGGTSDSRRNSGGISGSSDAGLGVVTTIKHQAVKGQTVLLPCPSQGSPPPRLSWLLPGNGMLPAPYYGSRLTVHRNGSLELRDVWISDAGIFICVAKSEGRETLIRVELKVSEHQENARSLQGRVAEKRSQTADLLNPAQPLISRPMSPLLHQQSSLSSPEKPLPVNSLPSTGQTSEPKVITRTGPLISTINGETFRLHCPGSQTQGSLLWTMPSGKTLSRGESGDSGRYVVQQDGTLIIKQASVFDRGSYTCKFSNQDSSSFFILTVPVIVIAYPPRITTGPSPVTYTSQGVAVELPCLTIATPRATVTWETPDLTKLRVIGQPRIYGNRYLSPQGSLVIQNPTHRDTGFYKCTAKNVIGEDNKATYLHVI